MKIKAGTEVPTESLKSNFGRLDKDGREILDSRPMEPPLGFKPTPDLMEMVRTMIANERAMQAMEAPESFEDADNFNTGEDMGPEDYEPYFEPTPLAELVRRRDAKEPLHDQMQDPPKEPPKASNNPGSPTAPGAPTPPVAAS